MAALTAAALLTATQFGGVGSAAGGTDAADLSELDAQEREWGAHFELSPEDTLAVFSQTDDLLGFQERHAADGRFGAVWATYDKEYRVHVRYLDASFEEVVRDFEVQLGAPVERAIGGASYVALDAARVALLSGAPRPESVRLNYQLGTVDVDESWSGVIAGIEDSIIRRVDFPEFASQDELAESGDDVEQGGTPVCTAAAMYREPPNKRGFITAGHCPNTSLQVRGSAFLGDVTPQAAGVHEYCDGDRDVQFVPVANGADLGEWARDKPLSSGTWPFYGGVAGGFYPNQPSFKLGLWSNGNTGSNPGWIVGWWLGTYDGACMSGTSPNIVEFDHYGAGGDSGGPYFLSYAGNWHWAGVHIGVTTYGPTSRIANWGAGVVSALMTPYGAEICRPGIVC